MLKKEIVPPAPSSMHNVLSAGTVLTGNLVTGDDIRIDGTVEGNIVCSGKVIVGTNGNITGDIECNNLDLMGKVQGNVLCSELIILRSSSRLEGDLKIKIIEIEPGAVFSGTCQMNGQNT
ncbi:cytoskeletal protein CcmA (bactofilin family) [Dysgonomonas sp. PH5-45]|uniref:bactofilin family protein n=1 Tax=unclassified Dysgonomonas TaxID=2630389 RepID=UPI002476DA53|nr:MULTISPECIES: polymer-forming cytoskeletal protein [unclassified Dysgonomonas]MDH6355672.1 cytoskeletal protein CcmA (bactofilin family) [Dysgonomonas sp. PH5-45]MDH6388569.1 cytoskeletal protein CcmA (bactofilin family) [Dysgonomonas sp. PH5-37]